jgi:small multidrug resistance pump
MSVGSTGWNTWALVAGAVACNASAQLLMKRAGIVEAFNWRQWLDPTLLAAVLLYGVSFILTALVFARMPLSLISPLMAGAIFVLISIFSVVFLRESLDAWRIGGMACILAGIALLSRGA